MTPQAIEPTDDSEDGASRRQAVAQLSETNQLYYDTDREHPVVLCQLDGWGTIGQRDYFDRTWAVRRVRCYLADSGCEVETITQQTKVERMESGRYTNLTDEGAERVLDEAAEENLKWWKANSPHIPYAGDGGVNVYVDDEWMAEKLTTEETAVEVGDDWPDPDRRVRVEYTSEGVGSLEVTVNGRTIPCKRVDPGDAKEAFELEADDHDARIELRVDDEYTDHHPERATEA